MAQVIDKKVELKLVGLDSNAFSIMGAFQSAARRQGWTKEEIDAVLKEAQSGDYNNLLQTIMAHVESPYGSDFGDDDEDDGFDDDPLLNDEDF